MLPLGASSPTPEFRLLTSTADSAATTGTHESTRGLVRARAPLVFTFALLIGCNPSGSVDSISSGPTGSSATPRLSISPRHQVIEAGDLLRLVAWEHPAAGDSAIAPVGSVRWLASGGTITDSGGFTAAVDGVYGVRARSRSWPDVEDSVAVTVAPPLTFLGDFENGFDGWNTSEGCCVYSHSIVHAPVRSGANALRIELRRTDPQVALGPRSELIAFPGAIPTEARTPIGGVGDEVWWAVSIYVPTDWVDDTMPEIVHQLHEQPDACETWRSPPFALQITAANWEVWSRWDDAPCTVGSYPVGKQQALESTPVVKGRWTDWVFHAKWSYRSDGVLDVWRDGLQTAHHQGPNTYNDQKSLYLKVGVYKWPWKALPNPADVAGRVIYYDEVRIAPASGSYAAVAPGGGPGPAN